MTISNTSMIPVTAKATSSGAASNPGEVSLFVTPGAVELRLRGPAAWSKLVAEPLKKARRELL